MHRQKVLTMTHEQKESIITKIHESIATLEKEIAELAPKLAPIEPDCCVGDERFEMMADQEVYERITHEAKLRITKLSHTLTLVDGENYGICAECDEPIAYPRLLLVPETKLCTVCIAETQQ